MSNIIKKQLAAYQQNFIQHGNSPQGTFQNNTTTQYERFNQLLLPLLQHKNKEFTICDIGSGVCDLHKFLKTNEIAHHYTGIEIVPEMIETAQKLYPEVKLLTIDVLDNNFTQKFDFVVLSGTFNLPGDTNRQEWEDFVFAVIEKMFSLATIGISLNALTTYGTFRADELFYLQPEKVLTFIQTKLSRFYQINRAYPLYEETYTVFTKQAMQQQFAHADFEKYFKN
jgi:hypothetical protein